MLGVEVRIGCTWVSDEDELNVGSLSRLFASAFSSIPLSLPGQAQIRTF